MNRRNCPVLRAAASAGIDLNHELRRFKRLLARCKACPVRDGCEAPEQIWEWVAQAAREALKEMEADIHG